MNNLKQIIPVLLAMIASAALCQGTWTQKNNFTGDIRSGAINFSIGNKGYIGLGVYEDGSPTLPLYLPFSDLWEYDSVTETWMQKADFPTIGRTNALSFSINNEGYVLFGTAYAPANTNELWAYNSINNSWVQKTSFPADERSDAFGFSISNKLFVGNGRWYSVGSGNFEIATDFWEYNTVTDSWLQLPDFPGTPRERAVAFSANNVGYVGLGDQQQEIYFTDFWAYNPTSGIWTAIDSFPGSTRYDAASFVIENDCYVGLGYQFAGSSHLSDFWKYDTTSDAWMQVLDFPGTGRIDASFFSIGNKAYVSCGINISNIGYALNDFWEFSPQQLIDPLSITNLNYTVAGNIYEFSFNISGGVGPYTISGSYLPAASLPISGNNFSYFLPCFLAGSYTVTDSQGETATINIFSPSGCSSANNSNWCLTATPVTCDTIITGTTIGETNDISLYWGSSTSGCLPNGSAIHAGPDKIYRLEKTETGNLSIGLQILSPNTDLDVFLLNSNCTTISCMNIGGSDNSVNNLEGIFMPNLPLGTYYIVIDSNQPEQQSNFILDISCGNLNCNNVQPILCGVTYNGYSTVYGENGASIYLCSANTQNVNNSGPEVIYSITTTQQGDIEVVLTNLSANLELFVLQNACNVQSCIGQSFNAGLANESILVPNAPAGTYYIVVDGFDGQSGTFSITVNANCPEPPPPPGCPTNPLDWVWLQALIDQTICSPGCNLTVTQYTWQGQTVADVLFEGPCFIEGVPPIPPGDTYVFSLTSFDAVVVYDADASATFAGGGDGVGGNNHSVFDCNGNLLFPWGGGLNPNLVAQLQNPVQLFSCICTYTVTPSIFGNDAICYPSSTTLYAGAGYTSYNWSNGAAGQIITVSPDTTTTYTVTVTDVNGCTGSASATVTVFSAPPPVITGDLSICSGSSTVLDAGGGYAAYMWSNGAAGQSITFSPATTSTYTVTVTNAQGCTATSDATVTVTAAVNLILSSVTPSVCGSNNGSIGVIATGGIPPYTYTWSHNAGLNNPNATGLAAGTYTVTVTGGGCTATASATVATSPTPTATATPTATTCGLNNGSISVTTTNFTSPTYAWSGGLTGANPTNVAAGTYTVTVTGGGCTATASATVTTSSTPTATATPTATTCGNSNGSIGVIATGGTPPYTYSWSHNSLLNSPNATGLAAGTYSVTVTDANGCTDTEFATVFLVAGSLFLDVDSTNPNCINSNGGSISITPIGGTPPYSYTWLPNISSSNTASGLTAGTYFIFVTDANGCTANQQVQLISTNLLSADIYTNNPICYGGNDGTATVIVTSGTPPYSYQWSANTTNYNNNTAYNLPAGNYTVTSTDITGCSVVLNAILGNPAQITANVITDNANCAGTNTGEAVAVVSGGTPPYTYLWSNGQTNSTTTGWGAGTHSVTVSDFFACPQTVTFTINEPSLLILSIAGTNTTCAGLNNGSATATPSGGTPPYIYLWSNGQSGPVANGLGSGNYTATVTDFYGCTAVASIGISAPAAITFTTSVQNVNCYNGSNGSIIIAPAGGSPPYLFNWWPNVSTTNAASGLSAGNYSVTITDIVGCTTSTSVSITQPAPFTVSLSSVQVLCNGAATGQINSTLSGGSPPYTYQWTNGQTGSAASNLPAGSYTVTVTDNNGCTTTASATITEPSAININAFPNAATCYGVPNGSISISVSGGIPGYSYLWSNGQTGTFLPNLLSGTYTVTVTDANGCTVSEDIYVDSPSACDTQVTTSNPSCNGGSTGFATVNSSGGVPPYSYIWSNGQVGNTATGLSGGLYFVTITDGNNCVTEKSVLIESEAYYPVIVIEGDTSLCDGGTTLLNVAETFAEYLWSNGAQTQSIEVSDTGQYSVTVSDSNGCTGFAVVTVIGAPAPIANAVTPTPIVCEGDTIILQGLGGVAYTWSGPSDFISASQNPEILNATVENEGIYKLLVTDAAGCISDTASISINVQPAPTISLANVGVLCADAVLDLNTLLNGSTSGGLWAGSGVFGNLFFADQVGPGNYEIGYMIPDDGICTAIMASINISVAQPLLFGSQYCLPVTGGYQVFFDVWGGTPPYTVNDTTTISNEGGSYSSNILTTPTYSIQITDSNGCTDFVIGDSNSCDATCSTPTTGIISPIDDEPCNNGFSVLLTSAPPSPYSFSIDGINWQGSDIFTNLSPGIYYVYVQHSCGYSIVGTYTATTTLLQASIELTQNTVGEEVALVTVSSGTPPYQYLWSSIGLAGAEWVNPILPVSVIIADAAGCETTVSLYPVEAPDITAPITAKIYPNPSDGIVYIERAANEPALISVFDALGRLVLQEDAKYEKIIKLNLSEKGKGLFVINLTTGATTITQKVLLF